MKSKSLKLAAVLFAVTALLVIDGLEVMQVATTDGSQIQQAFWVPITPFKVKFFEPQYDADGVFRGCWGRPGGCMVIVLEKSEVHISPDGERLEKPLSVSK